MLTSTIYRLLVTGAMLLLSMATAAAESRCIVNGEQVDCPPWFATMGIGFSILTFAFFIWAFVFWVYMLVHCLRSDMESGEKLVWVVVMLFASIIGSIIYYFVIKRAKPQQPIQH